MTTERATQSGRLGVSLPPDTGELFDEVARLGAVRIEEITSSVTPDTAPQLQDHDEWVVLLSGFAELELEGEARTLVPGDWLLLPAGTAHRVLRTGVGSRWLAVHAPAAESD